MRKLLPRGERLGDLSKRGAGGRDYAPPLRRRLRVEEETRENNKSPQSWIENDGFDQKGILWSVRDLAPLNRRYIGTV